MGEGEKGEDEDFSPPPPPPSLAGWKREGFFD